VSDPAPHGSTPIDFATWRDKVDALVHDPVTFGYLTTEIHEDIADRDDAGQIWRDIHLRLIFRGGL
jgi:hypothetical protein